MSHVAHNADPVAGLYEPATHAEQTAPSGPVYPLLHLHPLSAPLPVVDTEVPRTPGQVKHVASAVAATASEYLFAPQSVHAAGPEPTLYLPVEQPVHPPPPLTHRLLVSIF